MRAALLRYRAAWPAAGIILIAIVAYWFTLSSLADYLRLDTPLAYLLMLPFFSLLLAIVTVQRYDGAPAAPREPHIDLLIGIPLLLVAVLLVAVLPATWSTYYWTERPDVISLALFIAGSIVICYGFTWFWRLRSSLLFIVLMWPAFYLHFMAGMLQSFTDATNAVLTTVAQQLPFGVTSHAGGILTVQTQQGESLSVVLSTACSGANGVLGIALVGSALACVLEGRRLLKLLWLVAGMLVVFALNIVRIISILWLARTGHPGFALGSYHAAIGLALFTLTLVLLMLTAPRFRLHWSFLDAPAQDTSRPAPEARSWTLGRLRIPVATGLMATAFLCLVAERDLGSYAAFVDGTGAPTVKAFSVHQPMPKGWKVSYLATYDWAQQYFGTNSKFDRYALDYGGSDSSQAWMDIVRTDDQGALDAYNLQSCFLFHNYDLHTTRRIDIGHGVTALLLNYSDAETHSEWATVSWAWPVSYDQQTSYERVTLTTDLSRDGGSAAPDPQPSSGFRGVVLSIFNSFGGGSSDTDPRYGGADRALEGVATSIVATTVGGITT